MSLFLMCMILFEEIVMQRIIIQQLEGTKKCHYLNNSTFYCPSKEYLSIVKFPHNYIDKLLADADAKVTNINNIIIKTNLLKCLYYREFSAYRSLKYLELSENRIQHIAASAFDGTKLEILRLDKNKLKCI